MGVMLILRGINNLLHEKPAALYAERHGYTPEVLDASGETGPHSAQVEMALQRLRRGDVTALYGFSGGGYNLVHIWHRLPHQTAERIEQITVVGAPNVDPAEFHQVEALRPKLVLFNDPEQPHMQQPEALNKESLP